jgi:hypothetical protein
MAIGLARETRVAVDTMEAVETMVAMEIKEDLGNLRIME